MKTLFITLSLLCSLELSAQITYVNTDWVIDQTQIMQNGDADSLELDFDNDGIKDMRITSWSNHTQGDPLTGITVLMLHAVGFGGLEVAPNQTYISDCPATGFSYDDIVGFLYHSGFTNPYSNQYIKVSFKFQGNAGVHNGILYVRYVGTTITIEGYAVNLTPNGPCDCATTIWLSLNENQLNPTDENFEYYNLLGQQIDNPKGLVLKVFESGLSERIFINEQ